MFIIVKTIIFILIFLFVLRLYSHFRKDPLSPLSFWYYFIAIFIFSRCLYLLLGNESFFLNYLTESSLYEGFFRFFTSLFTATFAYEIGCLYSQGKNKNDFNRKRIEVYSANYCFISLFLGLSALIIYYTLLGGVDMLLDSLGESKSLRGGGLLFSISYTSWLAPVLFLFVKSYSIKIKYLICGLLLIFVSVLFLIYARATPVIFGLFLFLITVNYGVHKIKNFYFGLIGLSTIFSVTVLKSFRLMKSYGQEINSFGDFKDFFSGTYIDRISGTGGDSVITDVSILFSSVADSRFPLGSFWENWIVWIFDIIPFGIFSSLSDVRTVGRQIYAWIYGLNADTGIPIYGFIVSTTTGTIFMTFFLYCILGLIAGFLYKKLFTGQIIYFFLYTVFMFFVLIFTRIGDFSSSVIQVSVFSLASFLLLLAYSKINKRKRFLG